IDAADHVLRDSYADYLPFLNASVTPFAATYSSLTTPGTGWQAQLVLTVPFFDGGLRYGAREERSALLGEARIALEGALRTARSLIAAARSPAARPLLRPLRAPQAVNPLPCDAPERREIQGARTELRGTVQGQGRPQARSRDRASQRHHPQGDESRHLRLRPP